MISMRHFGTLGPARALSRAHEARGRSASRLATGLRIQSASDGAAELAISSRAKARQRSERMARRNLGAALDGYRIADGGLAEIHGALGRMRELATQAANGSLSSDDRRMLDSELGELVQQIDQVSESATLGELKLLVKNTVDVGFLVDSSASMNPMIAMLKSSVTDFAASFAERGLDVQMGLAELNTARDNVDAVRQLADIGAASFVSELNGLTTTGGAMDPVSGVLNVIGDNDIVGSAEPDAFSWRDGADRMVIYLTDTGRETSRTPATEQDAGNAAADRTVTVHVIGEQSNDDRDGVPGSDLDEIASLSGGGYYDRGGSGGELIPVALNAIASSLAATAAKVEVSVQAGADAGDRITTGFPYDARASALGIADVSIVDAADARAALADIDTAIDRVSSIRADAGSMMSRLETARRSLAVSDETASASISRLVDADVASEASDALRAELLTQVGASVLAQLHGFARRSVLALLT